MRASICVAVPAGLLFAGGVLFAAPGAGTVQAHSGGVTQSAASTVRAMFSESGGRDYTSVDGSFIAPAVSPVLQAQSTRVAA